MAHEFDTGFFVRKPAWHGLGVVLDEYPETWSNARKLAGLEWDPIETPAYTLQGIDEVGQPTYRQVEDWKSVVRSDNHTVLAMVKSSYQIIPNGEVGEVIDALLNEDSKLQYETAGSLAGGRKVWALLKNKNALNIIGDPSPTFAYTLVSTAHDGTAALTALATNVRVVCANTLRAAEQEASGKGRIFKFSHTIAWRNRIVEARNAIEGVDADVERYAARASALLGVKVSAKQRKLFIENFLPLPKEVEASERVISNVLGAREAVDGILESPTSEGIKDTAYGLVQAAVEYLDWYRQAVSLESRFDRNVCRVSAEKRDAARLVMEVIR